MSQNKNKKKFLKPFLIVIGSLSLSLGIVGLLLPILPTTPFILVTIGCFANSSERLHRWLLKSKIYTNTVDRFIREKGMTRKNKLAIVIPVGILLTVLFFIFTNIWIRVIIICLFAVKIIVFIKIPTIQNEVKDRP
jgi:uncharacterized membrane protein YbaN (DUF454 family)